MKKLLKYQIQLLEFIIIVYLVIIGCTLDVNQPVEPPLETWNPALNTNPDSLVFQDLLDRYVYKGLPGVVLYIRTPLGLWNGAAGYAKIESKTPMQPTHCLFAASVTKMYTAACVMLLTEDSLINLDNRISLYLPKDVYKDIPNRYEVTVRQLLGHSSGIPDFSGSLDYDLDFLNDPMGSYPPEKMLSYVRSQSAISSPGKSYFYSNANYILLALIMDYVSGSSHADIISERIIENLGLTGTYYKNETAYPHPPGLVNSYQDLASNGRLMNISDITTHFADMAIGYAGLIATSADYARFIEALFNGRIVNKNSLIVMQERTVSESYGLGLSFSETLFGTAIGHNGSDSGSLSNVRFFPDINATIVLLTNGGDTGITEKLFNQLWDEAMDISLTTL